MGQSDYRNDYRADWRQGHFRGPSTTWKQNTQAYAIGMSLTLFPVVLNKFTISNVLEMMGDKTF